MAREDKLGWGIAIVDMESVPPLNGLRRDLRVRAVLSGRLAERGNMVVAQAELIDVANGSRLWGGQYSRNMANVFALQEDLSSEISEKLRLRLTGEERQRLTKRYTENAEAYQLFLT